MTTFGPPPIPPPVHATPATVEGPHSGPRPWSTAAIGAFVLALLGWIGITAVLGLIFAGVAFYTTRGGRRRGLGLAIAAVPISLITGGLAFIILIAIMVLGRMAAVPDHFEDIFGSGEPAARVTLLRDLAAKDFNESVSDPALLAWFAQVDDQHGRLTDTTFDPGKGIFITPQSDVRLTIPSKFVNGDAVIRVTFQTDPFWDPRIYDIEVDGVSPRPPTP